MKTIIEMAEEAGAVSYSPPPMRAVKGVSFTYEQLDAFAELVRADEREACAKVAERFEPDEKTSYVTYASTAIRARGNT